MEIYERTARPFYLLCFFLCGIVAEGIGEMELINGILLHF